MNYNHLYHAGNIADIIKHLTLVQIIEYYQKKINPMLMIDTHSAHGIYNLRSNEALRSGEYINGYYKHKSKIKEISKVFSNIIESLGEEKYPGSAYIMDYMRRDHDKCIFNEKHPPVFEQLKNNLKNNIHNKDGYELLNAILPDKNIKRGIVHIDPPFENKTEFLDIYSCIKKLFPKFSNGTYMIWYPIKDTKKIEDFYNDMDNISNKYLILEVFDELDFGIYIINHNWMLQDFWQYICSSLEMKYRIINTDGNN